MTHKKQFNSEEIHGQFWTNGANLYQFISLKKFICPFPKILISNISAAKERLSGQGLSPETKTVAHSIVAHS
jgi:hypothetical protein